MPPTLYAVNKSESYPNVEVSRAVTEVGPTTLEDLRHCDKGHTIKAVILAKPESP